MGKLVMNTTLADDDSKKKKVRKKSNKQVLQDNLPQTIEVLGQTIKVEIKTLKDLYGNFSADKMTICLHDKYDLETSIQTLLHEMLHAMLAISGQNEMLSADQEEGIVRMLELALLPYIDQSKLRK